MSDQRVDAVIQMIRAGEIDDRIADVYAAISERNEQRKETVKRLVQEVFGDDFEIGRRENVFMRKARERAQQEERKPGEIFPGESPHVQQVSSDPFEEDETSSDFESRSPIFGARPRFD